MNLAELSSRALDRILQVVGPKPPVEQVIFSFTLGQPQEPFYIADDLGIDPRFGLRQVKVIAATDGSTNWKNWPDNLLHLGEEIQVFPYTSGQNFPTSSAA